MNDKGMFFQIYITLRQALGHQNWWPAHSPFEVMVGAVLTQNTNWKNVEDAIEKLREAGLLDPSAMNEVSAENLQELVRPAGYYRQKSARLKRLAAWVKERHVVGDTELGALKWEDTSTLREELLSINGIGPETADSILLYALDKAVFVVDTYTVRIMARHELIDPTCGYGEIQEEFQHRLPPDVEIFKDYHAQLVEVGKRFCKKTSPRCEECPLLHLLGEPVLDEFR
jgi:endonuclease-3 related protein